MAPNKVKVCRSCFKMNTRLHYLHGKLARAYKAFTGLPIAQDIIPPYLCTVCADELMKGVSLKMECVQAYGALQDIYRKQGYISHESLKHYVKTPRHIELTNERDIELTKNIEKLLIED